MALIVMTNFLCWSPVITMGVMAISGLPIPGIYTTTSTTFTTIVLYYSNEIQHIGTQPLITYALLMFLILICIFPIFPSLHSMSSATAYSWTAVFVLPLNSATNPVIYSL